MPDPFILTDSDLREIAGCIYGLSDATDLNQKTSPTYALPDAPTMRPGDCPPPQPVPVHIRDGVAVWEPWL